MMFTDPFNFDNLSDSIIKIAGLLNSIHVEDEKVELDDPNIIDVEYTEEDM